MGKVSDVASAIVGLVVLGLAVWGLIEIAPFLWHCLCVVCVFCWHAFWWCLKVAWYIFLVVAVLLLAAVLIRKLH